MTSEITVLPMRPDDLRLAGRLWWESSMSAPPAQSDHPTVEQMIQRLAGEAWRVELAWRGGDLVGMLAMDLPARWLRQLFVRPGAQRSGVGARLLRTARAAMPDGFFLHTHPQNLPARRFYEAQGLVSEGEQTHPIYGTPQVRYAWRADLA